LSAVLHATSAGSVHAGSELPCDGDAPARSG
jgi:hypothetical protein